MIRMGPPELIPVTRAADIPNLYQVSIMMIKVTCIDNVPRVGEGETNA